MYLLQDGGGKGVLLRRSTPIGEGLRQGDTAAWAALADIDSAQRCIVPREENGEPLAS
jgi:hypothetical protein